MQRKRITINELKIDMKKIIKWILIAFLMFSMAYAALIAFTYTAAIFAAINEVDTN